MRRTRHLIQMKIAQSLNIILLRMITVWILLYPPWKPARINAAWTVIGASRGTGVLLIKAVISRKIMAKDSVLTTYRMSPILPGPVVRTYVRNIRSMMIIPSLPSVRPFRIFQFPSAPGWAMVRRGRTLWKSNLLRLPCAANAIARGIRIVFIPSSIETRVAKTNVKFKANQLHMEPTSQSRDSPNFVVSKKSASSTYLD